MEEGEKEYMLQIQHICKEYRTGNLVQKALDDVSLNLRDNEFVAILGPSGSGKTTLLNIIGGLDRYDSGDLIINGISTKKYKDRDWDSYRNHTIGFVFQSYNLIPHQTVLSNVDGYNSAKGVEASMSNVGITVILALIGVGITGILVIKNVKGNILWGILITWILGIICQMAGIYVANPEIGFYSLLPDFSKGFTIPSIMPVFGKLDFSGIFSLNFIVVIFAFLFVDMFDTIGTLIGVSTKAGMLDEEGRLPNIKGALMADAVATTVGAVLGTTTTTTFVESASGVSEGGRTGLTSATTAILFGLSLFLSPIFLAIPSFATAPALIVVGFYMLTNVTHIDFDDFSEALPCYICILAMPFFYSISEGISMGVISYVILNLMTGKAKEKKISALMYVLTVLFILKYVFL